VEAALNPSEENKLIRDQILEELKAKLARDKEDQRFHNEEVLQQLNVQRMKFMEAEQALNDKKALHKEIMKRGLDFLAEVELGNAPPLEYVVRNINQHRQKG